MGLTIGIDVGGTKIAGGLVSDAGDVLASRTAATPSESADAVIDVIAELVRQLVVDAAGADVAAVGVGAAGFIDRDRSVVLFAPNLPWREEPLRDKVFRQVGLPVVVENDANAMAWGEFRFGAGQGVDDLVCLTLGTGIGGGIVLAGRLVRGAYGIAAEIGHVQVVAEGRLCGCGNRGCWEQYCSGRALVRAARELAVQAPDRAGRLLELADGQVDQIVGQLVTRAAREGDAAALECFAEISRWLGQGLADLAAVLDPARFVIGGGVIAAGDLLLVPARRYFQQALTAHGHRPEARIVAASLGPSAGMIGAADLARCG